MSNPPTEPPEAVNPADKPFYLVLVLLGAVIGLLLFTLYQGTYDSAKDVIISLVSVLLVGFGFYFKANGK